jgi:hypothetical protein
VFIPKLGRHSYSGPKDLQTCQSHIVLTQTMERLVDRFLRDEILAFMPLHPNQHIYELGNLWKWPFISSWFGLRRRLTNKR